MPQAPQLLLSVLSLTQADPHRVVPGVVQWHEPPAQTLPATHTLPQAPQLLLSVCSLTQADPQRSVPVGQWHEPPAQNCPAAQ